MSGRGIVAMESIPALSAHMRLRFDKTRSTWCVQAPERAFLLDPVAHSIVSRCDGAASVAGIVESLAGAHPDAPRDLICADVMKLLQDFVDKGVMSV